jgi:hypothetical protein
MHVCGVLSQTPSGGRLEGIEVIDFKRKARNPLSAFRQAAGFVFSGAHFYLGEEKPARCPQAESAKRCDRWGELIYRGLATKQTAAQTK